MSPVDKQRRYTSYWIEGSETEVGRRIDFPGARSSLMDLYTEEIGREPQPNREQQDELLRRYVAAKTAAWESILDGPVRFVRTVLVRVAALTDAPKEIIARVYENIHNGRHGCKSARDLARALSLLPHATDLARVIVDELHPDVLAIQRVVDAGFAAKASEGVTRALKIQREAVRKNLRLVFSQAKKYRTSPVPFEDLVSEGNLGLIVAVDRFNPDVKVLFSTYAVYWIRHAVSRAIDQHGRTIRVPVNARVLYGKLRQAEDRIERTGAIADDQALAAIVGVSVERVRQVRRDVHFGVSFDTVLGRYECGENLNGEVPSDQEDALEACELEEDLGELRRALGQLSPRHARILRERFGFDGNERTLQEIGNGFGLSRERIRQQQNRALDDLREHLIAARERR